MHIILGALSSIVTILWLLHRLAEMGIDLGGLNPWLWMRRRKWQQEYRGNPLYGIADPMEATALLMTAVVKADGDMSSNEKRTLLEIFHEEFSLSKREAADMLVSSAYLLGDGVDLRGNLAAVLKPSQDKFTQDQAESALEMIQRAANIDGDPSEPQAKLVQQLTETLSK